MMKEIFSADLVIPRLEYPAKTESPPMLYLFVFTQFRTQKPFPLLLELR
ncbi:hypothetical protein [Rhizobium terrae]|nr:hypothetical protein [Rhizobium terrae]